MSIAEKVRKRREDRIRELMNEHWRERHWLELQGKKRN